MADVVFKISEVGTDVRDAADYQLVISSSLPSLNAVKYGTFKATMALNETRIVVEHNLGYHPMFLAYIVRDDLGGVRLFDGTTSLVYLKVDKQNIVATRSDFGGVEEITITYFVFPIDLEISQIKPIDNVVEYPPSHDKDYGLKITLPRRDVSSGQDKDFSVHTSHRPFLLHQVAPVSAPIDSNATGIKYLSVEHGLPYFPTNFLFSKLLDSDAYQLMNDPLGGGTEPGGGGKINIRYLPSAYNEQIYSLVVMKDPSHAGTLEIIKS